MSLRLLFKRDILLVVLSKAANGTTTLALNLYAVHYLAPAEFGALTLCTTLLVLLDGMLGAALDLAVVKLHPLERLSEHGSPVEQASIGLKSVGCVAFGLVLTCFAPQIGMLLLHRGDARPLFLAWSIAATAVMTMRSTQLGLQLREKYVAFACVEFLNTGSRIALVVWMLHHGHRSSFAIMSSYAIGSSFALAVGLLTLMRVTGMTVWWKLENALPVLAAARNALLTYSISALVSRLDILILAALAVPAQLGLYGSAMTLASIPEIAATYLAPAFLPRIKPYCEQGIFVGFFRRFHGLMYGVLAGAYAALLWLVPRFGSHVLPAKYAPALMVTLVLLPGTLATTSIFPLSLNLLMLRGSRVFLYLDLAMAPVLVVAYGLASPRSILWVAGITSGFRILKTVLVQGFAVRAASSAQLEWHARPEDAALTATPA